MVLVAPPAGGLTATILTDGLLIIPLKPFNDSWREDPQPLPQLDPKPPSHRLGIVERVAADSCVGSSPPFL